jgi:thiosulfate/3-mercaptopyruvate sulfurtransferase
VRSYANDVLVDTGWVADHLDDPSVRIVEVDENRSLYAEGHIPGAIGLDCSDLQDTVRGTSLPPEELGAVLGARGISDGHTIVLYGDRSNWFAAYAYWCLRYVGHAGARLMDGPRDKWISEGRPTSARVPVHAPATFTAGPGDDAIRARLADVTGAGGRTVLVDVSSPQEFADGGVPGAVSAPWALAVNGDGSFRSRDDLEARYGARGILDGDPIITCCCIGERSAHTWFVLHELLGRTAARNLDARLSLSPAA